MKRKTYRQHNSSIPKSIFWALLTLSVISLMTFVPQTAFADGSAAEGNAYCSAEIEVSFTGLGANQEVEIVATYSTGQVETYTKTADSNGDISFTMDRYSNNAFTVTIQAEYDDFTITTTPFCPSLQSGTNLDSNDENAFVCQPAFHQVLGSTLNQLNPDTFEYTPLGSHSSKYNAIGYNTEDNYLYGLQKVNGGRNLIRINNKGVVTDLGRVDVADNTGYRGDFDHAGNLVVTNGSKLYKIDVSETPPTVSVHNLTKIGSPSLNFHDITFSRTTGMFYTYTQGQLIEINPINLTIKTLGNYSDIADGKPYGAAFSDANGDLFFSKNSTGAIYFADMENGAVVDFYPLAIGEGNSNNDGASCPLAAAPFEMLCSDGIDNDGDGQADGGDHDCSDIDGDNIVAILDLDDDNDGIPDIVEMATALNGGDTDNDGTIDSEDLDSDGDGDTDAEEAGHGLAHVDGKISGPFGDNGLADSVEDGVDSSVINYTVANDDPSTPPNFQYILDSDGDGIADIVDIDDDNDGIPDSHECAYNETSLPIAVVNGSFENPDIDFSQDLFKQRWGNFPVVAVTYLESDVNGWETTHSDNRIEVWQSGFGGVQSFNGSQHAEINANGEAALFQDVSTTPGSTMVWSFAHRGRSGPDTIVLKIGETGQELTAVRTITTDKNAWVVYSGEYEVPAGQTSTRFLYEAVDTASGNNTIGNFLDNIQFYIKTQSTNCTTDTDEDGIIDSLDLDSDGDGLSDAFEAGHDIHDTDGDGRLNGEAGDNGLVDIVETEPDSGIIDYSIRDTDENGIPNFQQFDDVDKDGVLKEDLDFDNDGIPNAIECTSMPCTDDFDGDGVPNAFDLDSDNDGLNDLEEIRPSAPDASAWLTWVDPDRNGVIEKLVGDNGYANLIETNDTQTGTYDADLDGNGDLPEDKDGDGAFNFLDLTSIDNGVYDIDSIGLGDLDSDNNGMVDDMIDHDRDGIPTIVDGAPDMCGDQLPTALKVHLTVNQTNIEGGDRLTFNISVKNQGFSSAHEVEITSLLPGNMVNGPGETGSWTVDTIPAGIAHEITWIVDVTDAQANQSYDVTVSATGNDSNGNPIPADNSTLIPADLDPDDSDTVSLLGIGGELTCETFTKNVAYEDLKNEGWSDWDYNDFIVNLEAELCYTGESAASDKWTHTIDPSYFSTSCQDVSFEAENASLYGFEVVNDPSASGGAYVAMPDNGIADYFNVSTSRMLTMSVNVPANAVYYVVGEVQGVSDSSDSLFVTVGDGPQYVWHLPTTDGFEPFYLHNYYNGIDQVPIQLSAGEHIITVHNREDGARLDKLSLVCPTAAPTPEFSLASAVITYTQLARGAFFDHALRHNLPFADGGQFTIERFDDEGNSLSVENGQFDPNNHVEIFDFTKVGQPPLEPGNPVRTQTNTLRDQTEYINGHSAVLRFNVNNPEQNLRDTIDPFPWDLYLPVHDTQQEVHLLIPGHMDNTQVVNAAHDANSPLLGHNLPLGFTFEEDWTWPVEFEGVWKAYPDFVGYVESGYTQNLNWFNRDGSIDWFLWTNRNNRFALPSAFDTQKVESRYFASPVVADLDQNGTLEIVIGDLIGNKVTVFDLDQNVVWSKATDAGVRATVVVEDIDFDGDFEILVGDESGKIHAWHHDGTVVASFPISVTDSRLLASPTVVDTNDNGDFEIIQVASDGQLYVVDMQGNLLWQAQLANNKDTFGSQEANGAAVVEDIDGDGDLEIIAPSQSGSVIAFDHTGKKLWSFGTGDSVTSTPAVGNVDPDNPGLEVVFGSGDTFLYVLDQDGELLWKRQTGWIIRSSPLLFDSDGDGFVEIFIGGDDQKVHAYHYWAETVDGWPQATGGEITSAPTTGDIDDDGEDEILIGGEDGKLYAWNADGSAVQSWPKQTGVTYKGSPVIINADGDGEEEIFAADFSGDLLIWGMTAQDPIISNDIFLPIVVR